MDQVNDEEMEGEDDSTSEEENVDEEEEAENEQEETKAQAYLPGNSDKFSPVSQKLQFIERGFLKKEFSLKREKKASGISCFGNF